MVDTADKTDKAEAKKAASTKAKQDKIAEEDLEDIQDPEYVSPRDPKLRTAELNSAPHPELWPAPDAPEDAEKPEGSETAIKVVPGMPSVNFEYTMKASGLPVNSGLTWLLREEGNSADTWLTHKSDPNGDAHIVWRTRQAGKVDVEIFARDPGETGSSLVKTSFEVVAPAKDRRFGEERGAA